MEARRAETFFGSALERQAASRLGAGTPCPSAGIASGTIIINVTGTFVIGLFGTLTPATGRFSVS